MMSERKLVQLLIGDEQEGLPVEAISLVKFPAIEENFLFFSKGKNTRALSLAAVDEDKRTLVGPALIPDKEIPRFDDETGEEYDVYFSQDTVKKASELYMMHNRTNTHTFEHQSPVEDVHVVESWLVEDPEMDKSKSYGLSMTKGTWMVRVQVANDDMWQQVKDGEIRGFSIEGYFIDSIERMNQKPLKAKAVSSERQLADSLWKQVKKLFKRRAFYTEVTLEDGTVIATEDDTMGPGSTVVKIDGEGQPTDLTNGKYKTQAGVELEAYDNVLVEYDGQVSAVEEAQPDMEDDTVVELNQQKVEFYKKYMKAKMKKEFGYFQEKTYNTAMSMRTYSGEVINGDQRVTEDVIEDWAMDDGWDIDHLEVYSRLIRSTRGETQEFEFTARPPGNFGRNMQEASLGALSLAIERAHKNLGNLDTRVEWNDMG